MSSEFQPLLGDYVSLQRGTTYKGEMVGRKGPVLLGLASIAANGGFRHGGFKTYGGECPAKITLHPGDLYVSLKDVTQSGDLLGSIAQVPADIPSGRLTQDTVKLVFDGSIEIPKQYVYWALRTPAYREYCRARATGTTTLGLARDDFLGFPLPLPSVEDLELVQLLDGVEARIALLRETNATLEAIAQALFKSWFVDFDPVRAKMEGRAPEGIDEATVELFPDGFEESAFGPLPTGWKVNRLGDVVKRITKGTTPTTLKRKFVEAGINFVKAESMTDDGGFLPDKFAFIDNDTHDLLGRSQLNSGDVLISIAGTIGRVAVMTEEFLPANTNQAVALIRPIQDRLPSGLISRFLQRDESRQMMGERVVQAVQANLSLGTLSDLPIVLPPPAVTSRLYQSGMAQVDACKSLNSQKIRTLATLRDTLLPRLISGQLRLPETLGELEAADAV
jgi:type I restriction enzyme S subunit